MLTGSKISFKVPPALVLCHEVGRLKYDNKLLMELKHEVTDIFIKIQSLIQKLDTKLTSVQQLRRKK